MSGDQDYFGEFSAAVILYMDRRRGVYAPTTWKTLMRRYRRIDLDLKDLLAQGKISTVNPCCITSEDLRVYLVYRRDLGYSSKEYDHDESAIRGLLKSYGNNALEVCLNEYPLLKSHKRSARLPPLQDGLYSRILANAKHVHSFDGLRAYSLVLLCIKCSCRTKEIRLAKISDIDTERWILHIAHPKGEDSYGEARDVAVHPEIRPIIERYLLELQDKGFVSSAMFPSDRSKDGYLAENSLRRIKRLVEDDMGESFDFRACRRTFGQQLLDQGVDIETVSVLMGHKNTRTTENSYARRRNTQANDRLRGSWS